MGRIIVSSGHTGNQQIFGPSGATTGCGLFKGLRPPAADPQQNEGMMLRGYENHEAIALVTCAS